MKKQLGFAVCLLAIAIAGVAVSRSQNEVPSVLRVASISLTADIAPQGASSVLVFVPTGSLSPKCLLTMNETNDTDFIAAYCAATHSDTAGDGIVIRLSYSYPIPADYTAALTVWQDGAKSYGTPVQITAGLDM